MGSPILTGPCTTLTPILRHVPATSPQQLGLIFDDARLRNLIEQERQVALRALASLLLEASGLTIEEAGDGNA
jgi:hypothetical protein